MYPMDIIDKVPVEIVSVWCYLYKFIFIAFLYEKSFHYRISVQLMVVTFYIRLRQPYIYALLLDFNLVLIIVYLLSTLHLKKKLQQVI